MFGLSQTQALVLLFVVLPFVLAAIVVPLVAWSHSGKPRPVLTSEILAHGDPGQAEIVSVRNMGNLFDPRPMVRFALKVTADSEPFDLEVVQSFPRDVIRSFHAGDVVQVRLTPDRTAGAVVWSEPY